MVHASGVNEMKETEGDGLGVIPGVDVDDNATEYREMAVRSRETS